MAGLEPIKFIFYFFRLFGFCSIEIIVAENVSNRRIKLRRSLRWTVFSSLVLFVAVILLGKACLVPLVPLITFQGIMLQSRFILANLSLVVSLIESIVKLSLKIKFFEAIDKTDVILQKFNIQISYKCRKYIVSVSHMLCDSC